MSASSKSVAGHDCCCVIYFKAAKQKFTDQGKRCDKEQAVEQAFMKRIFRSVKQGHRDGRPAASAPKRLANS